MNLLCSYDMLMYTQDSLRRVDGGSNNGEA
jgi:hypothetical protein